MRTLILALVVAMLCAACPAENPPIDTGPTATVELYLGLINHDTGDTMGNPPESLWVQLDGVGEPVKAEIVSWFGVSRAILTDVPAGRHWVTYVADKPGRTYESADWETRYFDVSEYPEYQSAIIPVVLKVYPSE
jgi:hypothetical protein